MMNKIFFDPTGRIKEYMSTQTRGLICKTLRICNYGFVIRYSPILTVIFHLNWQNSVNYSHLAAKYKDL